MNAFWPERFMTNLHFIVVCSNCLAHCGKTYLMTCCVSFAATVNRSVAYINEFFVRRKIQKSKRLVPSSHDIKYWQNPRDGLRLFRQSIKCPIDSGGWQWANVRSQMNKLKNQGYFMMTVAVLFWEFSLTRFNHYVHLPSARSSRKHTL
jgi:hypothetical protein